MAESFLQLLDATIHHLQNLKARGVRYVTVSQEVLDSLTRGQPVTVRSQVGASAAAPTKPAASPVIPRQPVSEPVPARVSQTAAVRSQTGGGESPGTGAQPALLHSPSEGGLVPRPKMLSPEAKAEAFAELRQRVMPCVKCAHLAASRKNVVFGVGDINARLMFVGEAPGADEDTQGEPFVGKAGQLLTRIIETMGLSRDSVYIANILKCRPDTPGQSAGNRKPTLEEMQTCIPYLHEQIDLIGPEVIVALGATAVEGLLGKTIGITRLRGNWRTYRGIPLMPTYHPAYLLRNQALSEKRRVWEDMLAVMVKLALPISERQKGYFLKGA